MRVAELLDNHFLSNGNWQGLSLSKTTVVWLAFILSEGDHRLYRVEPWGLSPPAHPRSRRLGIEVQPRDLTDDRLATILDYLSVAARWGAFIRRYLNQSVVRVYDLQGRVVRVDMTTAGADAMTERLFQVGTQQESSPRSAAGENRHGGARPPRLAVDDDGRRRPRRPTTHSICRRLPRSARPPSVPASPTLANGQYGGPWYTRRNRGAPGLLLVPTLRQADAGRGTRPRARPCLIARVLVPSAIRLPNADWVLDETDEPVAMGFVYTVALSAPGSIRAAPHVARAPSGRALAGLCREPGEAPAPTRCPCCRPRSMPSMNASKGKPRMPDEATASQATVAILAKHRVDTLVRVNGDD